MADLFLATLRRASVLAFAASLSGCVSARSLTDPRDRPTTHTAYSVRGVALDVTAGGSRTEELVGRAGVAVGVGGVAHVQANLAHAALGVASAGVRVTALDRDRVAIAAEIGGLATRGDWLYFLPKEFRDPLQGLTLASAPMAVVATTRIDDVALLSLAAGYDHSVVLGNIDNEALFFDGVIGARRLWLRPSAHIVLGRRVLLEGTALVPYAMWGLTNADAYATVRPGVQVGIRSQEWRRLPALPGLVWQGTVELRMGLTRIRLGVSGNPILRRFGVPVAPYAGLRWVL